MNHNYIITHFSQPQWPLVNKISTISKSGNLNHIHCATIEKLEQTLSGLSDSSRALFFTDEKMIGYLENTSLIQSQSSLEIAMFISSKMPQVAGSISSLEKVKYLIGMDKSDSIGRDLGILIKKFRESDILDLEKYLAFGADLNLIKITNTTEKKEAVNRIHSFISALGDPGYDHPFDEYARKVSEMTDELLINAIFNANPRLKNQNRSEDLTLNPNETVELRWGFDGDVFGVSVKDPFGQFNRDTIMKYISAQRYVQDVTSDKSAGLGLKMILERSHHLIANVKKEKATEVIALVKFEPRNRDFDNKKRSFYYFSDIE